VDAQERVASAAVDEWEQQERANVVVSLGDYIVGHNGIDESQSPPAPHSKAS
jgi:hypothetical protein